MEYKVFKVIIAGGRDFNDYDLLKRMCNSILIHKRQTHTIIILSGLAKGADTLAVRYADEQNYQCLGYTADWGRFGKSAGIRRNAQMAENADALIAFWDGSSRGTKNMIEQAQAKGLQIRIIKY